MSNYTFDIGGKSFTVKGEGITEAQARSILDAQSSAGSLVGLKSGQSLSAATQALGGLKTAQGQVGQALGTGLSLDAVGQGLGSVGDLSSVTAALPVTDAVNVADIAKQAPALTSIDQADLNQVRGALSSVSRSTGQAIGDISNAKGVGIYGFDAQQLEAAGYIKPGTAAKYLSSGTNDLTDVLKSPTVWTGKDNINDQANFLSSGPLQTLTQINLMSEGVSALKRAGVGTGALSGAALMGTALVAANGVENTLSWLKGQLPSSKALELDAAYKNGEFAANFADTKISDAMSQAFPALPAVNTVDRETLNAATGRVLGNDKIPDLTYSVSAIPDAGSLGAELNQIIEDFQALRSDIGILQGRIARTRIPEFIGEQYDNLDTGENYLADLDGIRSRLLSLRRQAEANDPPATGVVSQIENVPVENDIKQLEAALDKLRQDLAGAAQG